MFVFVVIRNVIVVIKNVIVVIFGISVNITDSQMREKGWKDSDCHLDDDL